jgi:hypothetical protein
MSNEDLMIASKTQPLKEALDGGIGTGEAPTDDEPDQQVESRPHWHSLKNRIFVAIQLLFCHWPLAPPNRPMSGRVRGHFDNV